MKKFPVVIWAYLWKMMSARHKKKNLSFPSRREENMFNQTVFNVICAYTEYELNFKRTLKQKQRRNQVNTNG